MGVILKKYIRLLCNICQRTVDKLVDNTRVSPDRCTITLNCQGRLFPVEYRSNGEITSAPLPGAIDWYPRQTSISSTTSLSEEVFIDTSTGSLKQVVLVIKLSTEPSAGATASLNLTALSDKPKSYKQYIYRRTSEFSTISGVEDGIAQKTLQFQTWGSNPDVVEVYLNGSKLQEGTASGQYQVDDGSATTPAPSNTIQFNTSILPAGTYQLDIIVSKAQSTDGYVLIFDRNEEDPNRSGAWDNVSYVERFNGSVWDKYYLFTLDLSENSILKKNSILYPTGTIPVTGFSDALLDDAIIFLARKPYSKVDRYTEISIPLKNLNATSNYLKYHLIDGELVLEVTDTSLETFFPPSRLTKFDIEDTIKTIISGDDEQIVVDGSVIVGPDS